jgi:outer membrane biosynthesis protein TonB
MPRARPRLQIFKFLLMLAVLVAVLAVNPAAAQRLRLIPVPPHVVPQWTPMPDLPQVYYAPNLPTDVFRHRGRFFLYWEGVWYRAKNLKGPWMRVDPPPAILAEINPSYFKMLPKPGPQPPGAAAPGQPPPGEVLLTPEGKPAVPPPIAPTPPTPPTAASAPPPQAPVPPAPVAPPQPPQTVQPQEPQPQAQPPESQESAPLAVPEGPMPKMM